MMVEKGNRFARVVVWVAAAIYIVVLFLYMIAAFLCPLSPFELECLQEFANIIAPVTGGIVSLAMLMENGFMDNLLHNILWYGGIIFLASIPYIILYVLLQIKINIYYDEGILTTFVKDYISFRWQ